MQPRLILLNQGSHLQGVLYMQRPKEEPIGCLHFPLAWAWSGGTGGAATSSLVTCLRGATNVDIFYVEMGQIWRNWDGSLIAIVSWAEHLEPIFSWWVCHGSSQPSSIMGPTSLLFINSPDVSFLMVALSKKSFATDDILYILKYKLFLYAFTYRHSPTYGEAAS